LGAEFIQPLQFNFEDILGTSRTDAPMILMVTAGADPTSQILSLAKSHQIQVYDVSMGEVAD
jgi:hypothetical protein